MPFDPADLIAAVANEDPAEFIQLIRGCNSRRTGADVGLNIAMLSRQQRDEMWGNLHRLLTRSVSILSDNMSTGDQKPTKEDLQSASASLKGIVFMTVQHLRQEKPENCSQLIQLVTSLVDFFCVPAAGLENLKITITELVELWWMKEFPQRRGFLIKSFMYLVRKCTTPIGMKADVKRVWHFRECLNTIVGSLVQPEAWDLFTSAVAAPIFLCLNEGKKFLSLLFLLDESLTERLHRSVKSVLPTCSLKQAESYGDIYFFAWKASSEHYLEKLETHCIQDLMFHCIHADHTKCKALYSILRKLLGSFHSKKSEKSVSKMLLNLYEPILWRSLKVANGFVRSNAAGLFFDIFPMEDSDANLIAAEELMEKQYLMMSELLEDPFINVRCAAILGVCNVFHTYWELIPSHVISKLLVKLVKELAFDSSSADVRASVFKGLTILLQNTLSHPTLKSLLPKVSRCFHDISEKVRCAIADMLLRIRGLRTIKYWDVVPPEHLLARLELDSSLICRRIVQLTLPSYFPSTASSDELLERCLTLIQLNRGASRRFYQHSHKFVSLNATVSFIIVLCRFVKRHSQLQAITMGNEKSISGGEESVDCLAPDDTIHENTNSEVVDFDTFCAVLDVMCILWTGIFYELRQEQNRTIRKKLQLQVANVMPLLFKVYKRTEAIYSIHFLASYIPSSAVKMLCGHCLFRLRVFNSESDGDNHKALLQSLCNWGRLDGVLELVSEWLTTALEQDAVASFYSKNTLKNTKRVRIQDPHIARPELALHYLGAILCLPVCRITLLKDHRQTLLDLMDLLKNILRLIKERLSSALTDVSLSIEFLLEALKYYCLFGILLCRAEDETGESSLRLLKNLFVWGTKEIAPCLGTRQEIVNTSYKHVVSSLAEDKSRSLAQETAKMLLDVSTNMMMVGVCNAEILDEVINYARVLLDSEASSIFAAEVMCLISQILCLDGICEFANPKYFEKIVLKDFNQALLVLADFIAIHEEQSQAKLKEVTPILSDLLLTCFQPHHSPTLKKDAIATVMAAVIADVSRFITDSRESSFIELDHLPPLSSSLVSVVTSQSKLLEEFTMEITECLRSEAVEEDYGCAAVGIIIMFITTGARKVKTKNIKMALLAYEECINNWNNKKKSDVFQRHLESGRLITAASEILQELKKRVGMAT